MREKSQVEDIDRSIYDIRDEEKDAYRMEEGLTPQIVDKLSKEKGDPVWMQQFRLQSLQIYNSLQVPNWGPDIEDLDMDNILRIHLNVWESRRQRENHLQAWARSTIRNWSIIMSKTKLQHRALYILIWRVR